MNTQEKAALLLEEFARSRSIADLAFGEDGDCALVDENEKITHVQVDAENDRVLCFAALGELPHPAACEPEVLYALLAANFCWGSSCGATLAIEAQSGQLMLQHALPVVDADAGSFARFIDEFIAITRLWEDRFAALQASPSGDDSPFVAEETEMTAIPETMIRI